MYQKYWIMYQLKKCIKNNELWTKNIFSNWFRQYNPCGENNNKQDQGRVLKLESTLVINTQLGPMSYVFVYPMTSYVHWHPMSNDILCRMTSYVHWHPMSNDVLSMSNDVLGMDHLNLNNHGLLATFALGVRYYFGKFRVKTS